MKTTCKLSSNNSSICACTNLSLKIWKADVRKITASFPAKKIIRLSLVLLFAIATISAEATIYYSKATGNANDVATWGTNTDGTGTAPGNFTTPGDVFILTATSNLTTSSLWTIANNVTLQIIGTLTTGASVTISGILQLDGFIAVTGDNDIFQIGSTGIAVFTNPSATQVSLAGAGAGNNFTFAANSRLRTVNVNGISGANCSLPADAPLKNIQFSTGTNYEFNGTATQATLGLIGTVDNLTINNSNGVNLNNNVRVTETLFLTNGIFNIGSNTLTLDKEVTINTGSLNAASATVIYNKNANTQTVLATNYNNLTFTNFNKILPSTSEIGIAGTFTPGTATGHTITGSTINFNGAGPQTIPAFNYNNLTSSNTGTRTLAPAGTIGVAGAFTPGSNSYTSTGSTINFNGTVAQTIPAFNYHNLTSSSSGARTLASTGDIGVAGLFTPGSNSYTIIGSTINFNGSGSQIIPAFNYNNLTSSSIGARTLASGGTIGIAGTFTSGSNSYTITSSTINFNGSGAQTIPAFNYNNLTSSSTGPRTLASTGNIGIAASFTPGSNSYTITGSTVIFNSAGGQIIPAFNYNNLTVASTSPRGIVLASSGTIGISGAFTPNTASNSYTSTGSTVDFNGSGAQTIPLCIYNNVITSNAGTKTITNGATTNGNLAINDGTILTFNSAAGFTLIANGNITLNNSSQLTITDATGSKTHTINFAGNLTVNTGSTFSMVSGDDGCNINFTKAGDQSITGDGTIILRSALLNKSGIANRVLVSTSLTLGGLTGVTNAFTFSSGTWEQTAGTLSFASNNSQQLSGAQGKVAATGTGSINFGGDAIVSNCTLQINTSGTIAVGGTGNKLEINSTGNVQLQNGTLNVGGRLINSASTLIITGGMLNINTAGLTLPANATFEMSATSTFTITNGSIVFQNANANTGGDLLINAGGSKSVTGGTTQFGNNLTPVSQAFKVNSQVALHNILVNGINNPTAQLLAALTISNDVTVNAGGTINANNQNITTAGNFSNDGTFTAGTGTVTFNGIAAQIISGAGTTFNNLTLNNTAGLDITGAVTVDGILNFQSVSGLITPTGSLTIGALGDITNASAAAYINGKLARVYSSVGSKAFPIGKGGNYHPLTLSYTVLDATSTVETEVFETSIAGTLPAYTTLFPNRQWNTTQSGANAFTFDLTVDGTGFTTLGDPVILKDGTDPLTAYPATYAPPDYTSTGLTGFGNFALASQCFPPTITTEGQPQDETKCVGDPVTFNVTASGPGHALFTYQWRKDGADISGATSTSYTINSVTTGDAGSYDVVVSRPCGTSTTSDAATLIINIPPAITSQPSSQTVCEGENVIFSVSATGTGLTYQWKKDGEDIDGETNNSIMINNVTVANSGNYTVVVSGVCPPSVTSDEATLTVHTAPTVSATHITGINNDANVCTASVTFGSNVTSGGIPAPTVVYKIGSTTITSPYVFAVGTTTVTVEVANDCGTANTTFDVTVTDNELPVLADPADITVNTDAGQCYATVALTAPVASDQCGTNPVTATDIPADNHFPIGTTTVTWSVTDYSGNRATQTQDITVATTLAATASAGIINCNGETATLTVNASGGGGTYTYSLNGGAYQPENTFAVTAGTYIVTVNDNCGSITTTNSVNVSQPTAVTVNTAVKTSYNGSDLSCATSTDGQVTVTGGGGTGTLQYSKDNGANYQASNVFSGLGAGDYQVKVKDANSCVSNNTISVTITAPPTVTGTITSQTNATCTSTTGSATVTGSGGTGTLQYSLDGGAFVASGTFANLSAGAHTVVVRDVNGCTATVPVNILQTGVSGTISSQADVLCFGAATGSVTVTASGGTSPYKYQLNSGMFQNSNTFNNLAAGNYTITIRDKKGCIGTVPVTITQPDPTATLVITLVSKTDVSCKNGSDGTIQVSASGGTPEHTFSLNGGAYTNNTSFTNLTAGNYTVTVKDGTGCTNSISVTIKNGMGRCPSGIAITSITQPPSISSDAKTSRWLKVAASPNPTTTEFTLVMHSNSNEKVEIVVTNMYGKKVYQTSGDIKTIYKFGNKLAAGMYIVRVIQGTNVETLKLIKGE